MNRPTLPAGDSAGLLQPYDIALIGAGMAGASLAAALLARAPALRVVLAEAEARPGLHATGRSAAFWTESYGGPGVVPLTLASHAALEGLGVLRRRGALTLARAGQEAQLEAFAARYRALGVSTGVLGRAQAAALVPGLKPGWIGGVMEPDCCDIDVARLHQHYLAEARRAGADLLCGAGLASAEPAGAGWQLHLADGRRLRAGVLVNAAGAWADEVARRAGAVPLGIQPYRRTMAQLRVAPQPDADLPLVLDLDESFYFKPQSGRLWLTPHDETPSAACDAAPEEIDVASAIARLEHRWAGLRSFAPDRLPAYGWDGRVPGFFWCAGQGGFGIQTAPAGADLAARLLLGEGPGAVNPVPYDPRRFALVD
ncbi:MAG TPA: FAD-dependent oxidoreductase [Novosphingobium sp.]|nr:FAD-dependent oxidoreductase [Novosphingobium sp.]